MEDSNHSHDQERIENANAVENDNHISQLNSNLNPDNRGVERVRNGILTNTHDEHIAGGDPVEAMDIHADNGNDNNNDNNDNDNDDDDDDDVHTNTLNHSEAHALSLIV